MALAVVLSLVAGLAQGEAKDAGGDGSSLATGEDGAAVLSDDAPPAIGSR